MSASPPPTPRGRLLLVPTPLDHGCDVQSPITDSLPLGTLEAAARTTHWICENAKSTRAFLKRVGQVVPLALALQEQHLQELPRQVHKKGDHLGAAKGGSGTQAVDVSAWLAPALQGLDVGLISEAGMPAVADPGSSVVRAAHALGIRVCPLVGPVSLLLALAASGLNGQNFAFVGYLPQEAHARAARLQQLETLALQSGQTQLWIETPYRNPAMLASALQVLRPSTRLAVACGLTLGDAQIHSLSVAQWKKAGDQLQQAAPADRPAVFALGA